LNHRLSCANIKVACPAPKILECIPSLGGDSGEGQSRPETCAPRVDNERVPGADVDLGRVWVRDVL
jgi:hypothetical protein